MGKTVLAAANSETQKYFLEPDFSGLPMDIQEEVKAMCAVTAEKLGCTFIMGFEATGDIYFQIVQNPDAFDFDEIGAELEMKEIRRTKKELLKALKLWYLVFHTPEGEKISQELLKEKNVK